MKIILDHILQQEAGHFCQTTRGAFIHRTAIVHFQPMNSAAFARPLEMQKSTILDPDVMIGPHSIIYAGSWIGEGTVICPFVHIQEGVKIGRNCVIGAGVHIGYNAEISDDCKIMDNAHIGGHSFIGPRCFISVDVIMVNDDDPRGYKWKGVKPVRVEEDCVIGAGARLRPGITIGKGSTIAMGSLVTRSVSEGSFVKGPVARPFVRPFAQGLNQ